MVTIAGDEPIPRAYDVYLDTAPGLVRVVENAVTYEFPQGDVAGITINGPGLVGEWPSVYVEHLLATTPLSVRSLFGYVYLSPIARDLDNVAGRIDMDFTDGCIALYDQDETAPAAYQVDGEVHAQGARTFGGVVRLGINDNVILYVTNAGGTVNVPGTSFFGGTRLVGGSGVDTFNVDPFDGFILGPVQIAGNGGVDTLNMRTGPDAFGENITITPTGVSWGSPDGLTYSSIETLTVTAAASEEDQTFILDGTFTTTTVTIDGGSGIDTLRTPNTSNTWLLTDHATSRVAGVTFQNFEHLEGSSLGDSFRFVGGTGGWPLIDGKGGVDSLDYSLQSVGVTVDLASGTASRVTGIVTGIEQVYGTPAADTLGGDGANNVLVGFGGADSISGGGGDDILDGGDGADSLIAGPGNDVVRAGAGSDSVTGGLGDDILYGADGNDRLDGGDGNDALFGQNGKDIVTGGAGRDILFGGAGTDALDGGPGDDILASGSLTSDGILARVNAIRSEWASGHTYADRVSNLRGDSAHSTTYAARLNGNHFLTAQGSVSLPAAPEDSLTGGWLALTETNNDWFFGLSGEFLDRQANEEANG